MLRRLIPRSPTARRNVFLVGAGLLLVVTVALVQFAVRVRDLRAHRATGPAWSFPSRVFSGDVPLEPGRELPRDVLLAQLAARGYVRTRAPEPRAGTWWFGAEGFRIALRGFPDAPDPRGRGGPEVVRLRIAGDHVATVERLGALPGAPAPDLAHPPRLEPVLVAELFDAERVRRTAVPLARIPQSVQDAVVAAEDRRFYGHLGLDARANVRAIVTNLRSGEVREGASTITQQLARGLFLGRKRTFARKAAEAVLATGLEALLSKPSILEMYLNSVYWGQARGYGVGGVAEAARWYFDTPVESLRVEQAALLAGMIRSPISASPFEHPQAAREKRNAVLDDLVETKKLTPAEGTRLKAAPLGVKQGPAPPDRHPSYVGAVRERLAAVMPRHADAWGLSIFTPLDLVWQAHAERTLAQGLARLDMTRRGPGAWLEGAFVALEPGTGDVRALVGGRDPDRGDFNRATQAKRQPGSAIKPIVYATALSSGMPGFTPASTVPDDRKTWGRGRWAWTPRNVGDSYHPSVTLVCALARSLNVATANVVEAVTPQEVARMAERFGLGRLKPVMSIGLGSNEVTPLALVRAYAVFADGGMLRDASPIMFVLDGAGRIVHQSDPGGTEVLPPTIAALMTGLLEDVVQYGVAYPLVATYGMSRPVAGKTGTTNDEKDAWFVGFTPQVVAGVWIGYDRPRSLGRQAAHTALPLWAAIVDGMLRGHPPARFRTDDGLEWADIDPWTGYLAWPGGPSMRVPFVRGTAPRLMMSDTLGGYSEDLDSVYADTWTEGDTLRTWEDSPAPEPAAPPDTVVIPEPEVPEPDTSDVSD